MGDCLARMHLSQEMAQELIPILKYFVKHGRLPDKLSPKPRPRQRAATP